MIPTLQLGQLGLRHPANSGPLWTPASLAVPPSIWLNDASSVTGVTNASQWNDISGNGYHVAQPSAGNQPTINATGLDGKRTLSSDGGDLIFNSDAGARALTKAQSAVWCMIVNKCTDSSAALRHLVYVPTTSASAVRFAAASSTGSGQRRYALRARRLDGDAAVQLNISAALDTNWHVLLFTLDYAARTGTIYIDGAQDAQNTTFTSAGGSTTSNTDSATDAFRLYGDTVGNSISETAEVIFGVGGLPDSTEIDKLFGYAHHRWGLESLLAGGHPYKTTPP